MENKIYELYVPGRLCLLGEHSDWAGKYRNVNNKVEKGYALVTGIEEGIKARVSSSPDKLIVRYKNNPEKYFETEMDLQTLKSLAEEGGYWCYIAGVAASVKELYNVGGLEIDIEDVTLPEKKGLSSSAAICVLVARAFNMVYNLHLNTIGEMNLAYLGEIATPSRCGKLDQACAFGKKPVLMTFDGDKLDVRSIKVGADFHFVFADLKSHKDTIKILADLNKCYPFPESEVEKNVNLGLGEINKKIVNEGLKLIEDGKTKEFGELMVYAQEIFDTYVAPACPQELTAVSLHKILNDEHVYEYCYGAKGVGSQGDGTVQFLAKSAEDQIALINYLKSKGMDAYSLTLNKTKPIKKAIIPLAGNGTRMYPITKLLKKAFLPIVDDDGLVKPAVAILLEELYDAGIEEICLIIDREDQKDYDKFFASEISEDIAKKLSPEQLAYESKISKIGKKLKYVYQDEKLGFGHAVSLCEGFANGDNVLLVLGDQLYKTDNNESVTQQLIENFDKNGMMTVSVFSVPLEDVSKYGILSGKKDGQEDSFSVDKMVEKPDQEYASEYLYTMDGNDKKYYSVFGEYIITDSVFKKLRENIANGFKESGEYQLTSALDSVREQEGMMAFIPDGEMLDVGNVQSYKKTLIKKLQK